MSSSIRWTKIPHYSGARIFSQANHCLTKSYLEPYVSAQMRPLVHMLLWAEIWYSDPLHPLLATIVMVASQEGYD